jgi:hypothetical protein
MLAEVYCFYEKERSMKKTLLTLSVSLAAVFMWGCDSATKTEDSSGKTSKDGSGTHAHGEGPHGGTVADWGGGKYHVEFTVNHDKQEATVYILGGDEKTPSPIDAAEITLTIKEPALTATLKASPQEGDGEGKSSRFVGNHEGLGVVREYEGSMSGVVGGVPYSGNFKEVAH